MEVGGMEGGRDDSFLHITYIFYSFLFISNSILLFLHSIIINTYRSSFFTNFSSLLENNPLPTVGQRSIFFYASLSFLLLYSLKYKTHPLARSIFFYASLSLLLLYSLKYNTHWRVLLKLVGLFLLLELFILINDARWA